MGEIPTLGDIPGNIRTISPSQSEPSLSNLPPLTQLLSSAGLQGDSAAAKAQSSQSLYPVGQGLPPVPRRLAEMILKGEYVDFSEFPPAKGKVKSLPNLEGNILVIQAADLAQYKKLIPDLATWLQCFAIFMAIITKHQPERSTELLAYMTLIVRSSTKYRWPSWVIYDQNFRLEAATGGQIDWAKSDASLFAQCFTGQTLSMESWCKICHSLDHGTIQCPYAPTQPKRPKSIGTWQPFQKDTTCRNFQIDGRCRYGKSCRFDHLCRTCRGKHPQSKCTVKNEMSVKGEEKVQS